MLMKLIKLELSSTLFICTHVRFVYVMRSATLIPPDDEVYVDKEFLLLIHYLFWVCTCEGSYSNQIL